jgi:hypothetical protein
VTVSGVVPDNAVRRIVLEAVHQTPGVEDVIDQLTEDLAAFAGEATVATLPR